MCAMWGHIPTENQGKKPLCIAVMSCQDLPQQVSQKWAKQYI